jgi:hypothetical protein
MVTGYLYHHDPPLLANALLTNFQNFDTGIDQPEAWPKFEGRQWTESRPNNGDITFVQRIGMWPAMTRSDEQVLRQMLGEAKPASALIGKGVEMMREMAEGPAGATIGRQVTSICIPRDPNEAPFSAYHTAHLSQKSFIADSVMVFGDAHRAAFRDVQVEALAGPRPPYAAVPKVRPRQPCPCGSGKRYKNCHGRNP